MFNPSVLRPRDPNVIDRYMQKELTKGGSKPRAEKKAPLATSEQLRNDRKHEYFRRIRDERQEKQFAKRADDVRVRSSHQKAFC